MRSKSALGDTRPPLDPDLVVMKSGAAIWRNRIGAGQRIYAAAIRIGSVGPDRLCDQHTTADTIIKPRVHCDLAASIAEHDLVALIDSRSRGIGGMNQNLGSFLPRNRARSFGERRVEEIPRRRSREAERMSFVCLLDHIPMIWERRHALDRARPDRAAERHVRPIRLEAEFAVWPCETPDIMGGGKIGLTIDPAFRREFCKRAPTGCL